MKPMTAKRLRNFRSLRTEIEVLKERIELTSAVSLYGKRALEDIPQKSRHGDRVAQTVTQLYYLQDALNTRCAEYVQELAAIDGFIAAIPDSELRVIFEMRYIRRKSWTAIAFKIGHHDEQYPRRKHDRFLQACGI